MEKLKKYGTGFLVAFVLAALTGIKANAGEEAQFESGTVWEAAADVDVREIPDGKAKVTGTLTAGETVLITESEMDGWCKIENQSVEGYVPVSTLQTLYAGQREQIEQEFGAAKQFGVEVVDEYEYLQKRKRASVIWGVVIGVLVAAVFAVGIVSALKSGKEKEIEELEIEEIGEDES